MNKKPMTYEEAQAQLEAIVSKVENNEFGLDELGDQLKRRSSWWRFARSGSSRPTGKSSRCCTRISPVAADIFLPYSSSKNNAT